MLRAVARQEEFTLGLALQRVLANRLMDRLKVTTDRTPAGNRPIAGRARQEQTAIAIHVLFPRSSMDELMKMLSASYMARMPGRRPTSPRMTLHFPSASALLLALGAPAVMDNMSRLFKRVDWCAPARTLLEPDTTMTAGSSSS